MCDDKSKQQQQQQLCELTMLNQPSDNILSSRVFIERLNDSHKAFLKLILSDAATLKEITTRTVIKVDQFESTFGKTFKELVSSGDQGEMTWWILRTRGTKGLGVIGLTQDDHNKVITVEQLVRPEIQNTTLAAEALYTLAKVYEEVARRNNTLSAYYEYKLIVTTSVAEAVEELMDSFTFNKHYLANGKIQYEMKTGDFYNSATYKQRSSNLRQVELTNGSKIPPNQIDLVLYTQLHGRKLAPFPYRGIMNFAFNPVWKKEKVYNSLPALGCNKQHLIGSVTIQPNSTNNNNNGLKQQQLPSGINWLECYLCVYLVKSGTNGHGPNSIVYQAKRNKRDGYPLVFSQFGFKKVNNTFVSEIKLQPKSQALDENGKHARIYCIVELWHNLIKLDQYETEEFFTHSEDRRKKSGASVPPLLSTDSETGRVCVEGAPNTPTTPSTPATPSSITITTTRRRRTSDTVPYIPNRGSSPSCNTSTTSTPPTTASSPRDDKFAHSKVVMAASIPTLTMHSTPYMWNTRNNPPYCSSMNALPPPPPPPPTTAAAATATTTSSVTCSSSQQQQQQQQLKTGSELSDGQQQLPSIQSLFHFVDQPGAATATTATTSATTPTCSNSPNSSRMTPSPMNTSPITCCDASPSAVSTQMQYCSPTPPPPPVSASCYSCSTVAVPVASAATSPPGYVYGPSHHHHHSHPHAHPTHPPTPYIAHSCGYMHHHPHHQHSHACVNGVSGVSGVYNNPHAHPQQQQQHLPHPSYYPSHYHAHAHAHPPHHHHHHHNPSHAHHGYPSQQHHHHHSHHFSVYDQPTATIAHSQHYTTHPPPPPPPHYTSPPVVQPMPSQHFPTSSGSTVGYVSGGRGGAGGGSAVGYPNGGTVSRETAMGPLATRPFYHNHSSMSY